MIWCVLLAVCCMVSSAVGDAEQKYDPRSIGTSSAEYKASRSERSLSNEFNRHINALIEHFNTANTKPNTIDEEGRTNSKNSGGKKQSNLKKKTSNNVEATTEKLKGKECCVDQRRYGNDVKIVPENPNQDISSLSKSKHPPLGLLEDAAGATQTKANLEYIKLHPPLAQAHKYGSNTKPLVNVFLYGGAQMLLDVI